LLFNIDEIETTTIITKEKRKKVMPTKDEKNNFSIQIENTVLRHKISYIEAITHYCDGIGLEVEIAATLLSDNLRSKIEAEAQQLRYLPRGSKLPI
jgi:UDP-glucose 6-dehydrogenase